MSKFLCHVGWIVSYILILSMLVFGVLVVFLPLGLFLAVWLSALVISLVVGILMKDSYKKIKQEVSR